MHPIEQITTGRTKKIQTSNLLFNRKSREKIIESIHELVKELSKDEENENSPDGSCKITYGNGQYVGGFSNSKRNGYGEYKWNDGNQYQVV